MSETASSRLRTFEVDDDETLVVMAGRDEVDNRIIYQGRSSGRYAIVPVEALAKPPTWNQPDYGDKLDFDGMMFVGDAVRLHPSAPYSLLLMAEEKIVKRLTDPGVYHSLRIPFEQTG